MAILVVFWQQEGQLHMYTCSVSTVAQHPSLSFAVEVDVA